MAALQRRRVRPCTHILSRGKPVVKPLWLYYRRVVIQSSGQGGSAPRPFPPSPPQRTGGRFARRNFRRASARRDWPPRESRNDKKAGTNDHHPARHLGGVGIKSRQRPHPSQGALVPASRRPHPPNDDAAANSRAERRASPGARISAAADGSSDEDGSSST